MLGGNGSFSSLRWNVIGIIAVMIGGALLLFLVLSYAFSVTSGLFEQTPPLE